MATFESSEMDMFSFFEMTPDLVFVAGKDGFFKNVNKAVIEKFEYSKEELLARPIFSFVHPEDIAITEQKRANLIDGIALINFENRYISKSGKIIWLYWTSFYLPEKEVVFAIAKDITEKKLREKEADEKFRKFKNLVDHFKNNIEKDRKYFAVELHEELAQLAAVIKMDIESVIDKIQSLTEYSRNKIIHASEICELMIETIRKISFNRSPHTLEDIGLNETIQWLCKDFMVLNKIPCVFESEYEEEHLSYEIKIDFFRVCQEAMSNIMDHANANSVKISITETSDEISLTIIDDGKGFDTMHSFKGSGLTNIGKRIASINGRLTVDSEPGKGTILRVTIPRQAANGN